MNTVYEIWKQKKDGSEPAIRVAVAAKMQVAMEEAVWLKMALGRKWDVYVDEVSE